jgi:AcrR family transcriptional regulator
VSNSSEVKVGRREKAAATRRRMLDAAQEVFVERGFAGTRMAEVAERAGVAVQTVYYTFHTKVGLFDACMARGVLGEDNPQIPQEQPFWKSMQAAATGEEALRHFVAGIGPMYKRVAQLDRVAAAAVHEPEAAAFWKRSEELRRAGYREALDIITAKQPLRAGLNIDRATDLLLLIAGHDVYCALVHDDGWPHEEWATWLSGSLSEMLLRSSI